MQTTVHETQPGSRVRGGVVEREASIRENDANAPVKMTSGFEGLHCSDG